MWAGVMEKRTPSFGVSPVGCLTVGVARGQWGCLGWSCCPRECRLKGRHGVWGCLAGLGHFLAMGVPGAGFPE